MTFQFSLHSGLTSVDQAAADSYCPLSGESLEAGAEPPDDAVRTATAKTLRASICCWCPISTITWPQGTGSYQLIACWTRPEAQANGSLLFRRDFQ